MRRPTAMQLPRPSQPLIVAVWAAIFFVGLGAGWTGYRSERERILDGLIDDVKRCAVAFEAADVQRLTGSRADVAVPGYLNVKRKLIGLQLVNPHVRDVYLLRFLPESGRV